MKLNSGDPFLTSGGLAVVNFELIKKADNLTTVLQNRSINLEFGGTEDIYKISGSSNYNDYIDD